MKALFFKKLSLIFLLFTIFITIANAEPPGTVVAKFPISVNFFAKNPRNSEIYASTPNSIVIIDAKSLKIVNAISVWGNPEGIAVSPDGTKLYVATSAAQQLAVIDLVSRKQLSPINLPYVPYDVAVGNNGFIYATPGQTGQYQGIMQIDAKTGKFIRQFSGNLFIYYNSFLGISPDRNTLYYGDQGLSAATLASFDISKDIPTLKFSTNNLGSNGQDLFVDPTGNYLYFAVGGGNWIRGYDIARIRTSDMTIQGSLLTGPYPHAIATSPNGQTAYAVAANSINGSSIQVWNTQTQQMLCQYRSDSDANRLITDNTGAYLFAALNNELSVYNTGCLLKK